MPTRTAGALLLVSALTLSCSATRVLPEVSAPPHRSSPPSLPRASVSWPSEGQASVALDGKAFDSPGQTPVPIASVAKVMTAYLAVHHLPPSTRLLVDVHDVAETARRRARGESVVALRVGEVLRRDEALTALMLPSANNVAVMLAQQVSGSWSAFVDLMNRTASDLDMRDTTYTDPSGYSDSTTSTAHDQLLLLRAALRSATLARVMGATSATLPVVGRVANTNALLGRDGFVAGKTGSTSAAGGCLVFRVVRQGRVLDGVVLGQRGGRLIDAGLRAASALADQALVR